MVDLTAAPVRVATSFAAASDVFRGALTCWLPPALPGEASGSWRTSVRGGLVPVTLECRATGPFSRPGQVSRHVWVKAVPSTAGGGAAARFVGAFHGDLVVRAVAGDEPTVSLRLLGAPRQPRWALLSRQVIRAFVRGVAERLASAPIPPPDADGGVVRTVVQCPVVRP